ncbi:MAG: hypothetical protein R6V03_01015 [Kiritimatiellia bacterium]
MAGGSWGRPAGMADAAYAGYESPDCVVSKEKIAKNPNKVYINNMKTIRYVHWQYENMWLGYLEDYPDYMTQGETLEEPSGKS